MPIEYGYVNDRNRSGKATILMTPFIGRTLDEARSIAVDFKGWRVGTSPDPQGQRVRAGSPASWHAWDLDSEIAAKTVKDALVADGMVADGEGGTFSTHVYIFRKE